MKYDAIKTTSRSISVEVDGETIGEGCRIHLQARSTMTLCPSLCFLTLRNISDSALARLQNGKEIAVSSGASLLAFGEITDVIQRQVKQDLITVVSFAPGLSLWEAAVSLSVPAGLSVSDTIRQILAVTGTGCALISYTGDDPFFSRGQTFHGRAADSITSVLTAAGLSDSVCRTPAGLCVRGDVSDPVTIPELSDPPQQTSAGIILPVPPAGWSVGQAVQYGEFSGLIREISVDADNTAGPWKMELFVRHKFQ